MKSLSLNISNHIVFSRWTRLAFAVFKSIGVAVTIAYLQFDLHKIFYLIKTNPNFMVERVLRICFFKIQSVVIPNNDNQIEGYIKFNLT